LRALDDIKAVFVADIHRTQRFWTERSVLAIPPSHPDLGHPARKRQVSMAPVTAESLVQRIGAGDQVRCDLHDSTRGVLRVDGARRRVWVRDGEEDAPRCWRLVVRREVKSAETIKYSLSNALPHFVGNGDSVWSVVANRVAFATAIPKIRSLYFRP
jgi:hypothetical protein